ncbi:hypothetical protein T439DRAFT_170142 [Meredithblackwellia eburnea MCA 4105]
MDLFRLPLEPSQDAPLSHRQEHRTTTTPPPTQSNTPILPSPSLIQPHFYINQDHQPRTPPPTPAITTTTTTNPVMLQELTRAKLERAAQGQMSGRRGAPSLREIVLLSNVFGQAKPSVSEEDLAREQEQLDLDRRRKEDEGRWLDALLDEMLEVEEEEDEREYVQVSFRGDDLPDIGDSGFLEQVLPDSAAAYASLAPVQEELDCFDPRASILSVEEEEDEDDDRERDLSNAQSLIEFSEQLPPPLSPPLPSRSPPIALADRPSRTAPFHFESASPPEFPPPLTPDYSPSDSALSLDLFGRSDDSSEADLEEERDRWLQRRGASRAGIFSLPTPTSTNNINKPSHHSSLSGDMTSPSSSTLSEPLLFGPVPPALDLISVSPDSLALAIIRPPSSPPGSHSLDFKPQWNPRPLRSLSVPPQTRDRRPPQGSARLAGAAGERSTHPSFHGAIVKSFYDCVDFGRSPRVTLPASVCGGLKSNPSPNATATTTLAAEAAKSRRVEEEEDEEDRKDLALVLAGPSLASRYAGLGLSATSTASWRSRSLSPDGGRRQDWARLQDITDDADENGTSNARPTSVLI